MSLLKYDKTRRRLWICGARIHHGVVGFALALTGAWLMWDDRRDCPWTKDSASPR